MATTTRALLAIGLAAWVAGCSSSDDGGGVAATRTPTPSAQASATRTPTVTIARTATPTATTPPTSTPTTNPPPTASPTSGTSSGLVEGLVVISGQLRAATDDALGAPPPEWVGQPDATQFDRALSYANWTLGGPRAVTGSTTEDGRFEIRDLPAGRYTLSLEKALNGNLVSASVPFAVGDDASASLVIAIGQGMVRSEARYTKDGAAYVEVVGPGDGFLVRRDGDVVELRGSGRRLIDPEGDGSFVPSSCVDQLWTCETNGDCGEGRICQCTASCPFCADCGQPVCAPAVPLPTHPYQCLPGGGCANPGERCACVSSCPECDDCVTSVCVPSCEPVAIESILVDGVQQLAIGRQGSLRAVAQLEDGSQLDVTYLAEWQSDDTSIATVDAWGTVSAVAVGTANMTASLGEVHSAAHPVAVTERPALTQLTIQSADCFYPRGIPTAEPPVAQAPGAPADEFYPFACNDTLRIGTTKQLVAFGQYADGSYEDLTTAVTWDLTPSGIGTIEKGLFTAVAAGQVQIGASLGSVQSNKLALNVVAQSTVVELSIYPDYGLIPPVFVDGPPVPADASFAPCFDCGFSLTVLRGDRVKFHATARYDTGEWEDVTESVTWRSTNTAAATIDADGVMEAVAAGSATIDAVLGSVNSHGVDATVVDEATLVSLYIHQDGQDRAISKGATAFFRATASYDVAFSRDVTDTVTWHSSDESVGGFGEDGVFVGRAAGNVEVWAELDGVESNRLGMEVFETSELEYCDLEQINRGIWEDGFNRVVLETDCAHYTPPAVAQLRFTVTERERPFGIFDPCLDLYVYDGARKVRTIREEGCGSPFLAPGAPNFDREAVKYQSRAFWDLKDDSGQTVPPGVYSIVGRFYLYFDPIITLGVAVVESDGRVPCHVNQCGNGCGYVHACGDSEPPVACPEVCTSLCECPPGWGITPEGDCEPCPGECCPSGAQCVGLVPCDPAPCCPPDALCIPELPSCGPRCCEAGQSCPAGIPECPPKVCCTDAQGCDATLPPCPIACCGPGETCTDERPTCP